MIRIAPYVRKDNLGLFENKESIFTGAVQRDIMRTVQIGNKYVVVNGLNENAPEVLALDKAEKEAKIKYIREMVAKIEAAVVNNVIEPKDKDFWSKVKEARPDNLNFWLSQDYELPITSVGYDLDLTDIKDEIKYIAIKAGGYSLCAKNYDEAKKNTRYKFYLQEKDSEITSKAALSRKKMQAVSIISDIVISKPSKLSNILACLDYDPCLYTSKTHPDVLLIRAEEIISGESGIANLDTPEKALDKFLVYTSKDDDSLETEAIVKKAISKYIIKKNTQNQFYTGDSNQMRLLGVTVEDVVLLLNSPENSVLFQTIKSKV